MPATDLLQYLIFSTIGVSVGLAARIKFVGLSLCAHLTWVAPTIITALMFASEYSQMPHDHRAAVDDFFGLGFDLETHKLEGISMVLLTLPTVACICYSAVAGSSNVRRFLWSRFKAA